MFSLNHCGVPLAHFTMTLDRRKMQRDQWTRSDTQLDLPGLTGSTSPLPGLVFPGYSSFLPQSQSTHVADWKLQIAPMYGCDGGYFRVYPPLPGFNFTSKYSSSVFCPILKNGGFKPECLQHLRNAPYSHPGEPLESLNINRFTFHKQPRNYTYIYFSSMLLSECSIYTVFLPGLLMQLLKEHLALVHKHLSWLGKFNSV